MDSSDMKPEAIAQATQRLGKACAALESFGRTNSPRDMASHWADFLIAVSGVYSKLEQGAKKDALSNPWFGRKKHERKNDPLMSYLHQARNSEEHGLHQVTSVAGSEVKLGPGAKAAIYTDGHSFTVSNVEGEVTVPQDRIKLVPVYDDRSGKWFEVPRMHMGVPIDNVSPGVIGSLALSYLVDLLNEAKGRVVDQGARIP